MKNATLKLCVKTLALTIALLLIGPTVCHAEEQATEAVEVNTIVDENIDTKTSMWDIPEEERTPDNFGPGILLFEESASEDIIVENINEESKEEPVLEEVTNVLPEPAIVVEQIKPKQPKIQYEEPIKEEVIQEPVNINNENRWGITLSNGEKEVLARIVKLECGGESDLGQQAVIEVIFNRVTHSAFSNSVIGVLGERGQFSTWKNRNSRSATPTAKEYANIDTVLNGQTHIFPFKTVFFSRGAQNSKIQARIGGHTFCNK